MLLEEFIILLVAIYALARCLYLAKRLEHYAYAEGQGFPVCWMLDFLLLFFGGIMALAAIWYHLRWVMPS